MNMLTGKNSDGVAGSNYSVSVNSKKEYQKGPISEQFLLIEKQHSRTRTTTLKIIFWLILIEPLV